MLTAEIQVIWDYFELDAECECDPTELPEEREKCRQCRAKEILTKAGVLNA